MYKIKSISVAAGLMLAIVLLGYRPIEAQEQSLQAGNSETVELRRRVKELEERLNKLEAAQPERNAPVSFVKAVLSGDPISPPATNPASPAQEDDKSNSQNKGVLGFFREVEVSGFIDGYYGYNFNKPANRVNLLRNFDTKSNQFALNLAEVVLEKKPDPLNSRVGFRLDLDYGPATDLVHASEPGGTQVYKVIQQAYGSYLAPVGSGLQIDVGKFVTWNGAEVIETKDNWNYSRGLLFAWAIPYYHAGVRAKYSFNSKVSLMGAIVNGWNNVEENNNGKTFGLSLTVAPTPKFSIIQNYTTGPEQINPVNGDEARTAASDAKRTGEGVGSANGRNHFRHLLDTIATYNFNKKWAVMGNYDYAQERLPTGDIVHWQGVAGYLHYVPTEKLAFTPRFEWFGDYNGFSTGTAQRVKEFTMTGEYKVRPSLIGRFEYRRDWSDQLFFLKNSSNLAKSQSTVLAGLIWTFSTRGQ